MITTRTVLVLGAGASMPYDFPSGWGLVKEICDRFDHHNREDSNNLLYAGYDSRKVVGFRNALKKSGQLSVDAFLEHRPEFIEAGKATIAYVLLRYENENRLFSTSINESWYQYLWSRLSTSIDNFENNKLSIVTFNYDRSLEYYLFNTMKNSFGLTEKDCSDKIKSIPNNPCPWQNGTF